MSRVRCPRCSTVVEVSAGETPVCPTCGFGRQAAPEATPWPSGGLTPVHDPYAAPTAAPMDTWGGTTGGATPGKIRSPGINFLLYVVTFGIYGLVWHWKIGAEMDAFKAEADAGRPLRLYVILSIITGVIMLLGSLWILALYFSAVTEADGTDLTDAQSEALVLQALPAMGLLGIGALVGLAGTILHIIGMLRVWKTTSQAQAALGRPPISTNMMLTFLLVYYGSSLFGWIPILGGLVSLAAIVLVIVLYVMTQNALNEVWRAHGAQG